MEKQQQKNPNNAIWLVVLKIMDKTSHQGQQRTLQNSLLTLIGRPVGACASFCHLVHRVFWGRESCRNLLPSPVLESYQKYKEKLRDPHLWR